MALSEGESAPPPAGSLVPLVEKKGRGGWGMKTNELECGDADQRPSRSPAISLCRSPHPEGARERDAERERHREREGRRPMSRHRSSHNTTDTNPGSVPLAPDCHKSDNGSRTEGEGQTEKSKSHSHTALIRQQRGEQTATFEQGKHL